MPQSQTRGCGVQRLLHLLPADARQPVRGHGAGQYSSTVQYSTVQYSTVQYSTVQVYGAGSQRGGLEQPGGALHLHYTQVSDLSLSLSLD